MRVSYLADDFLYFTYDFPHAFYSAGSRRINMQAGNDVRRSTGFSGQVDNYTAISPGREEAFLSLPGPLP